MSSADSLDPRLMPARPDLAAARLRGQVEAARFVEGETRRVRSELADVKRAPSPDAPLDTQLLRGEGVTVYEDRDGWCWVQAERDGYVGYVAAACLGPPGSEPTHRVIVRRTFVYPAPDMKRPIVAALPLEGRVAVDTVEGAFAKLADEDGYVIAAHLARAGDDMQDFVAVAEGYLGVPYLWGGNSVGGLDCSGLIQLAASATGLHLPRDTDLQETCGDAVDPSGADLRRGDLVFWRGHVGVLTDRETLLHANGHHMLVTREPLRAAQSRIAETTGMPVSSIRRLGPASGCLRK